MGATEYKTHFKSHHERKIRQYLWLRSISRYCGLIFVVTMYSAIPITFFRQEWFVLILYSSVFWATAFLLMAVYTLLRPQKTKNILAYYLLKASELFQAYLSEGDSKTKKKFLENCLRHIERFSDCLQGTLENIHLTLKLPDIEQLKKLRENVMSKIYPMIQDGHNTSDDVLLSLSRFFFYENEYEKLSEVNSTLRILTSTTAEEPKRLGVMARAMQNTGFRCVISIIAIVLLVFGGIYALKYPIESNDYWQYVGNNAATVVAAIVASSLAISLFHVSRARS